MFFKETRYPSAFRRWDPHFFNADRLGTLFRYG